MLRRDIRLFLFIGSFILLIVALYQLRSSRDNQPKQFNPSLLDLHLSGNAPKDSGRNLKSIERHSTEIATKKYSLQNYVIRDVRRFIFFVGYARSGHSILASLLDAHPNVVISHEYSLFSQMDKDPVNHNDKSWLFSTLFESSQASTNSEGGLRKLTANKKGYSLAVPGWWQGKYDGFIDIIGDKSGGLTAQVYRKSREKFKTLYQQLRNTVQIPIKVFHVVRNPYDNIATMLLYNTHQKRQVNETHKYDDVDGLRGQIKSYFNQVGSVVHMISDVPLSAIEVHNADMIANPKGVMRNICTKLQIECSDDYLHMCASTVYVSESKSRHLVKWTPELIDMVANNIKNYKHLQRYSFES